MFSYKTTKNIWGTICYCGKEAYILQDLHPYGTNKNVKLTLTCPSCNKELIVSADEACIFYNNKIFNCFKNVYGSVLELGCGGGLLTGYLTKKTEIAEVIAIDKDVTNQETDDEQKIINSLGCEFKNIDLDNFDERVFGKIFDFVVCRDVIMYLKDIDYTFKKLSKITKNMVLLNWYNSEHKNCHNKTTPNEVAKTLKRHFKKVKLTYPNFYKWGYLIECEK